MKRFVHVFALWMAALAALHVPGFAQGKTVPEIPFESVPNFLKLPPNLYPVSYTHLDVYKRQ